MIIFLAKLGIGAAVILVGVGVFVLMAYGSTTLSDWWTNKNIQFSPLWKKISKYFWMSLYILCIMIFAYEVGAGLAEQFHLFPGN